VPVVGRKNRTLHHRRRYLKVLIIIALKTTKKCYSVSLYR